MRLTSNEQTTPKFVGGSHQILKAPNYKCSAAERICAIVKPERQQPKQTASQRTAIHSLRRINEIAMLADVFLTGGALGLTFLALAYTTAQKSLLSAIKPDTSSIGSLL
jgi:hypothetical protein